MRAVLAWTLLVALALGACSPDLDDSSPEGALALFLDAMERSKDDRTSLEEAYRMLDSESRHRLAERARTTSALGARAYDPWEMIVEGRATLRFRPRRGGGLRARPGPSPDEAIVVVISEDGTRRAEIPMRRETEGWRVVLAVPEGIARAADTSAAREEGGDRAAPAD